MQKSETSPDITLSTKQFVYMIMPFLQGLWGISFGHAAIYYDK